MSRSYKKHYSDYHNLRSEYAPPLWGRIRARERGCVHDETRSCENGDVIFPPYYWNDGQFSKRSFYSKTEIRGEIRTEYFAEIQGILNNYPVTIVWRYQSIKAEFFRCFKKIRGAIPDNNPLLSFAWLNTKDAKQMIKAWKGDPFDVLYELTRKGVIEKAARLECKKRLRK